MRLLDVSGVSLQQEASLLSIHQTRELYLVHVELAPHIAHCAIHGYMPCAIDFSRGFWYGTCTLPCPFTFKGAKLLATSMSAVEWYKSYMCQTQREQGIVRPNVNKV